MPEASWASWAVSALDSLSITNEQQNFTNHTPAAGEVEAGTTLLALNAGFLWVISLLSTFLSPFVTSAPLLRSANSAAWPPAGAAGADPAGGGGGGPGGGGGGGGGGGPPAGAAAGADDADFDWYSAKANPCRSYQQEEESYKRYARACLRIPCQTGHVELFDITLQRREDSHVGPNPFYMLSAPI